MTTPRKELKSSILRSSPSDKKPRQGVFARTNTPQEVRTQNSIMRKVGSPSTKSPRTPLTRDGRKIEQRTRSKSSDAPLVRQTPQTSSPNADKLGTPRVRSHSTANRSGSISARSSTGSLASQRRSIGPSSRHSIGSPQDSSGKIRHLRSTPISVPERTSPRRMSTGTSSSKPQSSPTQKSPGTLGSRTFIRTTSASSLRSQLSRTTTPISARRNRSPTRRISAGSTPVATPRSSRTKTATIATPRQSRPRSLSRGAGSLAGSSLAGRRRASIDADAIPPESGRVRSSSRSNLGRTLPSPRESPRSVRQDSQTSKDIKVFATGRADSFKIAKPSPKRPKPRSLSQTRRDMAAKSLSNLSPTPLSTRLVVNQIDLSDVTSISASETSNATPHSLSSPVPAYRASKSLEKTSPESTGPEITNSVPNLIQEQIGRQNTSSSSNSDLEKPVNANDLVEDERSKLSMLKRVSMASSTMDVDSEDEEMIKPKRQPGPALTLLDTSKVKPDLPMTLSQARANVSDMLTVRFHCHDKWHTFLMTTNLQDPFFESDEEVEFGYRADPMTRATHVRKFTRTTEERDKVEIEMTGVWRDFRRVDAPQVDRVECLTSQHFIMEKGGVTRKLEVVFTFDELDGKLAAKNASLTLKKPRPLTCRNLVERAVRQVGTGDKIAGD